jgi:prepilin-type processing-associated H-X9-DG protein
MRTRHPVRSLAVLASLLACLALAGPAAAAPQIGGELVRGSGANDVNANMTNSGDVVQFIRMALRQPNTITGVTLVSGPQGATCFHDQPNNQARCQFDGNDTFGPGDTLSMGITTADRYPDGGGADGYSCPYPCPPGTDVAFSIGGPAASGGGSQPQPLNWSQGGWDRNGMITQLLPYIEQRPAFQTHGDAWGPRRGGRPTIVKTFICPSRPTSGSDPNPWNTPFDSGGWNQGGTSQGGSVNVLFGDGSVRQVDPACEWNTLFNALGTRRGGEPVSFDSRAAQRRRVRRLRLGVTRVTVPEGETRVVGTRMKARARRILKRQGVRRLRVEVRYTVTSPVGDKITATRTFTVKLRRGGRRSG